MYGWQKAGGDDRREERGEEEGGRHREHSLASDPFWCFS